MLVAGYTRVEKLAADHIRTDFRCGRLALDDWLRKYAGQNEARGSTRTFVMCSEGTRQVVGYYSLTAGSVERHDEAPRPVRRGMPSYPIPVIILARLAVDSLHQRKKLGAHLLLDAMLRSTNAATAVGVRALMVHALDEDARAWYEGWGFHRSPLHELQLFLTLDEISATLEAAGLALPAA